MITQNSLLGEDQGWRTAQLDKQVFQQGLTEYRENEVDSLASIITI